MTKKKTEMSCMVILMPVGRGMSILEGLLQGMFQSCKLYCELVKQKTSKCNKFNYRTEYEALSQATQEAIWLRRLLSDIGSRSEEPTVIFEDNQGAIEISKNAKFHNRTKHIDVRFHFIREKVLSNEVKVIYLSTEEMLADVMTKGLTKRKFEKLRNMLNISAC